MDSNKNILVCVTQQKTCERLITRSKELFSLPGDNLFVLHVVDEGSPFLNNPREGEALQYLFSVSKDAGASLTVLKSTNVVDCIAKYARDNEISHIVLGNSREHPVKTTFADNLKALLPRLEFIIIP